MIISKKKISCLFCFGELEKAQKEACFDFRFERSQVGNIKFIAFEGG